MKSPPRFPAATLPPLASPSRQRWGLASLSLSMLLAALGTSVANVGLPALALALHASFQQVQWVTLAYLLTLTALSVSAGRLGDLLGRRTLLLGGIAVFTLASALCALGSVVTRHEPRWQYSESGPQPGTKRHSWHSGWQCRASA